MIRENYRWLTETYIAHRGLFDQDTRPENSLPAFHFAVQKGFALETDVQMSRDGVLVVFHDETLERMTGIRGRICDYDFDQLRAMRLGETQLQIPTFDEFLQVADGTNIVVEIKPHDEIGETEEKVCQALANYKGNYCVESFDPFIVRWFKLFAPHILRGQLATDFSTVKEMPKYQRNLLTRLALCKWNGSQFIAFDADFLQNSRAVKKWARRVPIICWTIKSQQQYAQLKTYFDNMIFDGFEPERNDKVFLKKREGAALE